MKEIKLIQDDSGKITIESTGIEPQEFGSVDEAIEFIQNQVAATSEGSEEIESEEIEGEGPKTLEESMPMIDEEKKGMMPKKKPDWMDYSGM